MIDMHSHILPAVDDGSEDISMSVDMARMYLESDFTTVIATPHYIEENISYNSDQNKEALENLKVELDKEGIEIEILLGSEAYVSMDLVKDIEEGKISTLNDTRYVLIEFPMFDIPLYIESIIYELLLKGYIPIIAHPERNSMIINDPNILYNYIQKGALAQINLPSLEGKYGERVKETTETLLRHHMVHFLGTDAHTNRRRSPRVENAFRILKSIVPTEEYNNLSVKNPRLLLENKTINIIAPIEHNTKKPTRWAHRTLKKIISLRG